MATCTESGDPVQALWDQEEKLDWKSQCDAGALVPELLSSIPSFVRALPHDRVRRLAADLQEAIARAVAPNEPHMVNVKDGSVGKRMRQLHSLQDAHGVLSEAQQSRQRNWSRGFGFAGLPQLVQELILVNALDLSALPHLCGTCRFVAALTKQPQCWEGSIVEVRSGHLKEGIKLMRLHCAFSSSTIVKWPTLALEIDYFAVASPPALPVFYQKYRVAEEIQERFPSIVQQTSQSYRFDQLNIPSSRRTMVKHEGRRLQGPCKAGSYKFSGGREQYFGDWADKQLLRNRAFAFLDQPMLAGSSVKFTVGTSSSSEPVEPVGFMFGVHSYVPNLSSWYDIDALSALDLFTGFSSFDETERISKVPSLSNGTRVVIHVAERSDLQGRLQLVLDIDDQQAVASKAIDFPALDPFDETKYPGKEEGRVWLVVGLFGHGEFIEIVS